MALLVPLFILMLAFVRAPGVLTGAAVQKQTLVRVGGQVFDVSDPSEYYYAKAGSPNALTNELQAHLVGSDGQWHIFHFPGGLANLERMRSRSRRMSVSSLVQLTSDTVLETSFPPYKESSDYVNPLSKKGKRLEKRGAAMITGDGVLTELKKIVAFPTRSSSNATASAEVEHFLKKEFSAMGLKTCIHSFEKDGKHLANVVAYKEGLGGAADAVSIGAHYDSRPFKGLAPGADDNGSGTAALLAIAKAFTSAKIEPAKSVYFVSFGGEEDGADGSSAFAEALFGDPENPESLFGDGLPTECNNLYGIRSGSFLQGKRPKVQRETHKAIILDEVGWRSPGIDKPTLNIESYDWAKDVMDNIAAASKALNGDALDLIHNSHPFGSDHMSFLERHVPAALMINADDEGYPDYHKPTDTIDKVSPDYVAMIAKASFGGLMRLAGA